MSLSSCCVIGCKNTGRNNKLVSFHRVPFLKGKVVPSWKRRLAKPGTRDFIYNAETRICSAHFPDERFYFTAKRKKKLKLGTLPEYLPWLERDRQQDKTVSPIPLTPKTKKKQFFSSFSIETLRSNEGVMKRYTGFKSLKVYEVLFSFFSRPMKKVSLIHYLKDNKSQPNPGTPSKKKGRPHILSKDQEFFMTMMRLRRNIPIDILADMFGVSKPATSRIVNTWIIVMSKLLRMTPIWRSRDDILKRIPSQYKPYTNFRAILDCTEMEIERPSDKNIQKDTFSNYKQRNTVKGLVAISPDYQLIFASQLYHGSTSDKKIVHHCGILDKFEEGDTIMADRGFEIHKACQERKITLLIPDFLRGLSQLQPSEVARSREIARIRVKVENKIGSIKYFRILHQKIPLTLQPILEHIWTTCNYLVNFMMPLSKDDLDDVPEPELFMDIVTDENILSPFPQHRISRTVLFPDSHLQNVYIPEDCISSFMTHVSANTAKDIETCGVLVGFTSNNQLQISHIFIPKQIGDSTSCIAENESDIVDFVIQNELMTLGWIHTHPSHSAFLSSADLHTQFGYQVLLPESVAIVCSPLYDEYKYFTIEASEGMETIKNCNEVEYFHTHDSKIPLFHECNHVITKSNLKISILDLRVVNAQ